MVRGHGILAVRVPGRSENMVVCLFVFSVCVIVFLRTLCMFVCLCLEVKGVEKIAFYVFLC